MEASTLPSGEKRVGQNILPRHPMLKTSWPLATSKSCTAWVQPPPTTRRLPSGEKPTENLDSEVETSSGTASSSVAASHSPTPMAELAAAKSRPSGEKPASSMYVRFNALFVCVPSGQCFKEATHWLPTWPTLSQERSSGVRATVHEAPRYQLAVSRAVRKSHSCTFSNLSRTRSRFPPARNSKAGVVGSNSAIVQKTCPITLALATSHTSMRPLVGATAKKPASSENLAR